MLYSYIYILRFFYRNRRNINPLFIVYWVDCIDHTSTNIDHRIYIFPRNRKLLCPNTEKQRLIKITLKCSKAFLAPAFIKIPTFLLAQYIYQKLMFDVRYTIEMVIYYRRFWAWFHPLNLFLSPLPSLSLFLFLQLHPQNHFTFVGLMLKKIIHLTGCSIGSKLP